MTTPNEFPYHVFLSHSAKDKAGGRPLAERLRQNGWGECISQNRRLAVMRQPVQFPACRRLPATNF